MTTSEFSFSRAIRLLMITLEAVVVVSLGVRGNQHPIETPTAMRISSVLGNLIVLSFCLLVLVQIGCLFSPLCRFALFSLARLLLYALLAMTLVIQLA